MHISQRGCALVCLREASLSDNVLLQSRIRTSQKLQMNSKRCRAIMMADRCLLFDPDTVSSKKFLEAVSPRLQASIGNRAQRARHKHGEGEGAYQDQEDQDERPPFELECLEGAFLVAIGKRSALRQNLAHPKFSKGAGTPEINTLIN